MQLSVLVPGWLLEAPGVTSNSIHLRKTSRSYNLPMCSRPVRYSGNSLHSTKNVFIYFILLGYRGLRSWRSNRTFVGWTKTPRGIVTLSQRGLNSPIICTGSPPFIKLALLWVNIIYLNFPVVGLKQTPSSITLIENRTVTFWKVFPHWQDAMKRGLWKLCFNETPI